MNKKAFTLIELLAVIAILAIVMIIAVPTVLNTIATAKKGAFKDNVLSVIKAVEQKFSTDFVLEEANTLPTISGYKKIDIQNLDIDNKNKLSGYVYILNNNSSFEYYVNITDGTYSICNYNKSLVTTSNIVDKKTCEEFSTNKIVIENGILKNYTNQSDSFVYQGEYNPFRQIVSVKGGFHNNFIIDINGDLYAFGQNQYYELGSSTIGYTKEPFKIQLPSKVIKVVSGYYHTLVMLDTGDVYAFGRNNLGQLGIKNNTDTYTPTKVVFENNDSIKIKDIFVGTNTSYAISSDGFLYSWGDNGYGQLGIDNYTSSNAPIKNTFITGNIKMMTAGTQHAIVMLNDNTIYGFGRNSEGQLGKDFATAKYPKPISLTFQGINANDIKQIESNASHNLILLNNNKLYSFGYNAYNQLGNNSTTNSYIPIDISLPIGSSPIKTLFVMNAVNYALLDDGTVYNWGRNADGQLGNNTIVDIKVPTKMNLPLPVSLIGLGYYNTNLVLSDGSLYFCGSYGLLANSEYLVPTKMNFDILRK